MLESTTKFAKQEFLYSKDKELVEKSRNIAVATITITNCIFNELHEHQVKTLGSEPSGPQAKKKCTKTMEQQGHITMHSRRPCSKKRGNITQR
jgi:hypothetical protein